METLNLKTGALPGTPTYHVYVGAMGGPKATRVTVQAMPHGVLRHGSDVAVNLALAALNAPDAAFRAVYLVDVTPRVSGKHGAPMGRPSAKLDPDATYYRAKRVHLDAQGYDRGGTYWGYRPRWHHIYAVQDGMGNVAYIEAPHVPAAIRLAKES